MGYSYGHIVSFVGSFLVRENKLSRTQSIVLFTEGWIILSDILVNLCAMSSLCLQSL